MNRCLFVTTVTLSSLRCRARSLVILRRTVVVNLSMRRLRLTRIDSMSLRILISVLRSRVRLSMSTYVVTVLILSSILNGGIVGFARFGNLTGRSTATICALVSRYASLIALVILPFSLVTRSGTTMVMVALMRFRLKKVRRRVAPIVSTTRNLVRCRPLVSLISLTLMGRLWHPFCRRMRLGAVWMVNYGTTWVVPLVSLLLYCLNRKVLVWTLILRVRTIVRKKRISWILVLLILRMNGLMVACRAYVRMVWIRLVVIPRVLLNDRLMHRSKLLRCSYRCLTGENGRWTLFTKWSTARIVELRFTLVLTNSRPVGHIG